MNDGHLTPAEIAAASGLREDDPRRRHMDACARCRTLRVRYEQFVAQPAHVPAADLRDAEARLAEFLASAIAPANATVRPFDAGPTSRRRAWGRGALAWLGAPAFAAAAVALVAVTVFVVQRPGGLGSRPSGVLRGQAIGGPDGAMQRLAPVMISGRRLELRWRGVPTADRYEVRLYSPELGALAVVGTSRETVFVLAPGTVAGAAAGDTLLWRVSALHGEVRLAQSDLGIVRMP
jgi:hypothetical protein